MGWGRGWVDVEVGLGWGSAIQFEPDDIGLDEDLTIDEEHLHIQSNPLEYKVVEKWIWNKCKKPDKAEVRRLFTVAFVLGIRAVF